MKYTLAVLTLSISLSAFADKEYVYAQGANCESNKPPAYACCQHLANPKVFWVPSNSKIVSSNGIQVACFLAKPDFNLDSGPNNCTKDTAIYPGKAKIDITDCTIKQYILDSNTADVDTNKMWLI